MLNVNQKLDEIPEMTMPELDQLEAAVESDLALDEEDKDELFEAIDDAREELESDDEDLIDDEFDLDLDEDNEGDEDDNDA